MDEEVQLFASKLIARGITDSPTLIRLKRICRPDIDLLEFGEKVLEHISQEVEVVQAIMDETCDDFDSGVRAQSDPFRLGLKKDIEGRGMPSEAALDRAAVLRDGFAVTDTPSESSDTDPEAPSEPEFSEEAQEEEVPEKKPLSFRKETASVPQEKAPAFRLMGKGVEEEPVEEAPPSEMSEEDFDKMDLAQLAALAMKASARKTGKTEKPAGASAASTPAAAKINPLDVKFDPVALAKQLKIQIQSMGEEAPRGLEDRRMRPAEPVIVAEGIRAALPDFGQLESLDETQYGAVALSILLYGLEKGYSDIHLCALSRPFVRKHGKVHYLDERPMSAKVVAGLCLSLLSKQQKAYFQKFKDYDFAMALQSGNRFRVNLLQHKDGMKGTFRIVPPKPKTIEELGFGKHSETIRKLLTYHNGLILVTGPVGCGKTTTLGALLYDMNTHRTDHIITVEDPIEIVHPPLQCSVTQRGVGPHTNTFRSALKGALRQDPDIIIIGEMRDLETIEMAISASETGHLVIGTMHTSDASTTLNRVLDVFPPAQQSQIRSMVAESLRGIICQRLLPTKSGSTVLACEILLKNPAVAAMIKEGKQQGLKNVMETSKREGMILMDASVLDLWKEGVIDDETARTNINNEVLKRSITSTKEAVPEAAKEAETSPGDDKKGLTRRKPKLFG